MASLMDYLSGKEFSNGLQISFPDQPYTTRLEFLEKLCVSKRVLHIGFADHKDVINEKIKNNLWLHKRLLDVSQSCYGIDINCDSVEYVRKELGISNVYCLDIITEELPTDLLEKNFDIAILGEVIEHVNNPVLFLSKIKNKLSLICRSLVITTPNALRLANFEFALRGIETINTDHRYWFTPYTLMKVATEAGLVIQNLYFVNSYYNQKDFYLLSKIPILREDLVLIAQI
ncbi:class I SAM-dependent methyltransferase [Thermotoga profunda]|uniref:class I SAM-dependent methyltransferase n=1 Tax=Thermotoga profunda TaxID=1508420 RepID=UPI000596E716|nr:methyltransferase domain-containing protein [Thermotoga profunda]